MSPDLRLGRWQDTLDAGSGRLADGSVRLLLTSPPYDNARTYEGTNEPVDFGELARFALRVLMPGGTLAMVLDGMVEDGVQSVTPYRVICEWAALEGWRFRQCLVYGRQGVPGLFPGRFRRDHEPLIVFVRDCDGAVWGSDRVAERGRIRSVKGRHARKAEGSNHGHGDGRRYVDSPINRGSLWWYGNVGGEYGASASTGHPATFAEAFALDAVTVWSNRGDLVCDPFAGSCTTGRACVDTGRRFVGAERVPKYHAIGVERLRQTSIFDLAV